MCKRTCEELLTRDGGWWGQWRFIRTFFLLSLCSLSPLFLFLCLCSLVSSLSCLLSSFLSVFLLSPPETLLGPVWLFMYPYSLHFSACVKRKITSTDYVGAYIIWQLYLKIYLWSWRGKMKASAKFLAEEIWKINGVAGGGSWAIQAHWRMLHPYLEERAQPSHQNSAACPEGEGNTPNKLALFVTIDLARFS